MISRLYIAGAMTALVLVLAAPLRAQEQQQQQQGAECPMHQKHQDRGAKANATADHSSHTERHAEMDRRGDQAMGFSQSKTAHHFLLKRDGGSIEVEASDAADRASRDQIRLHLIKIAREFAEGKFDAPVFIHAQTPPGVPTMKQLKDEIKYEFAETERGGRLNVRTNSTAALAAIHEFLRFQIQEHRTGDPLEVRWAEETGDSSQ
jgi:hypothetical protein